MALTPEQWSFLNRGDVPDAVNIYDNWVDFDPNMNYRDFSRLLRKVKAPSRAADLFGYSVRNPIKMGDKVVRPGAGVDADGNPDYIKYLYSQDGTRYLTNPAMHPLSVLDYGNAVAKKQSIVNNRAFQATPPDEWTTGMKAAFKPTNDPLTAYEAIRKGRMSLPELDEIVAASDDVTKTPKVQELRDTLRVAQFSSNPELVQQSVEDLKNYGFGRYEGQAKNITGTDILPVTEGKNLTTSMNLYNAGMAARNEASLGGLIDEVNRTKNIAVMPSQMYGGQIQDTMGYVNAYEKDSVPFNTLDTKNRANQLQDAYDESIQQGALDPLYRRQLPEAQALTRDFNLDSRYEQGAQNAELSDGRPKDWGLAVKTQRRAQKGLNKTTNWIKQNVPEGTPINNADDLLRYATSTQRGEYYDYMGELDQANAVLNQEGGEGFNQRVVDQGRVSFKGQDGKEYGLAGTLPIKGDRVTNADYLSVNPLELAAESARMQGNVQRIEPDPDYWKRETNQNVYQAKLVNEQRRQAGQMEKAKKIADFSYIPTTPGQPREFLTVPPRNRPQSSPEALATGNLPNSDLRLDPNMIVTPEQEGMFTPDNMRRLMEPDTTGVVSVVDQTITDTPIRLPYTVPAFTRSDELLLDEEGNIVWTPAEPKAGSYLERTGGDVPREQRRYSSIDYGSGITPNPDDMSFDDWGGGRQENRVTAVSNPTEYTKTEFPSLVSSPSSIDTGDSPSNRFYTSSIENPLDAIRPIVGGATITSPDNAVIGLFDEDTYDFSDNPVNQNTLEYLGDIDRQYQEVQLAIAETADDNPLKEVLLEREGALRANRNYLASQLQERSLQTGVQEGQANLTNALRFQEVDRQRVRQMDVLSDPWASSLYQEGKNNFLATEAALRNAADELATINPATERLPNPAYVNNLDTRAFEYVKASQGIEDDFYVALDEGRIPELAPINESIGAINERIGRLEQSPLAPDIKSQELSKLKGFQSELYQQALQQEEAIKQDYIRRGRNIRLKGEPTMPTGLANVPSNQFTPSSYTDLIDDLVVATDGGQTYRPEALPGRVPSSTLVRDIFPGDPANPNPMAINTRRVGAGIQDTLSELEARQNQALADYVYNAEQANSLSGVSPRIRQDIMGAYGVTDPAFSSNVGAYANRKIGDPSLIPVARFGSAAPPVTVASIGGGLSGQTARRLASAFW